MTAESLQLATATIYSAYPENVNCKFCEPSVLKFYIFCGLYQAKKSCKFELDILNSSRVIATQKYIEHIMKS